MANRYVWSGAAGAGTGADWANAFTTLTAACAADSAGDVFYVAHDHAESTASSITLNVAGTEAAPSFIYCVNRAGSVPPVAADLRTTGTVSTTGASTITINGSLYCYGLTFTAANSTSQGNFALPGSAAAIQVFDTCPFVFGGTGASGTFQVGLVATISETRFKNLTITFSAVSQTATFFRPANFENCVFGGAALPTNLFSLNATSAFLNVDGCDLSAFGSGKNIFSSTTHNVSRSILNNCKLGASVTIASPASAGITVDLVNCDSGDTNYRNERHKREGVLSTETTIVRTGGASNGTTTYSWKVVTVTAIDISQPFDAPPIACWNETTGSAITLTVEGTWGGGAVPTNADIWLEAQYLGTSGFPLGTKATNGKITPLHTATNHAASSAVWGGGTTDFAMALTFTPQEKGWIYVYPKIGVAGTFYIDPKVAVS